MSKALLDLSIHPTALKVVRKIGTLLPKNFKENVRTFAWYNGRERGISLVVGDHVGLNQTVIVVNERRNSDDIVIDVYERPWTTDQPCWQDPGYDKAVQERTAVAFGEYEKAACKILDLIAETVGKQDVAYDKFKAQQAKLQTQQVAQ